MLPKILLIILTLAGGALAVPSAESLLAKKGFAWKLRATAHMNLRYESGSYAEARIDKLAQHQERAFARNVSLLGVDRYETKTDVFVVESLARMKALVGEETDGIAFPSTNVAVFIYSESIDASGAHELMHVMAVNVWGKGPKLWLMEGLAVYADDEWHRYPLHNLSNFLRQQNKLIALEDLISDFDEYDDMITYPQSASFVKFIYERYGREKLRELWQKGSAKNIRKAMGKEIEALETEWREHISRTNIGGIKYEIRDID